MEVDIDRGDHKDDLGENETTRHLNDRVYHLIWSDTALNAHSRLRRLRRV